MQKSQGCTQNETKTHKGTHCAMLSHSVVFSSLWSDELWLTGSSVHGIFQARILELVAIS